MHHANFLRSSVIAGALIASVSSLTLVQAADTSGGIDPKASQLLRQSLDYLASQKSFSVRADSSLEVVLDSGQKIQMNQASNLAVQRPNKLRASRVGDELSNEFFYDGKTFNAYNVQTGYYATAQAPKDLDGAIQFAQEKMGVISPGGDLIASNAYDLLMRGVTSGVVIGKSVINGVKCDHLAFRAQDTDWQIWLESGKQPLPRKLVITSVDVLNAPQFSVEMKDWKLKQSFKPSTFEFKVPKKARPIEFLTADQVSAQ